MKQENVRFISLAAVAAIVSAAFYLIPPHLSSTTAINSHGNPVGWTIAHGEGQGITLCSMDLKWWWRAPGPFCIIEDMPK